jgi:hypothetical protein
MVQRWVRKTGMRQDTKQRRVFWLKGVRTWGFNLPPKDELARLYLSSPFGEGKPLEALCQHYGVSMPTIRSWLNKYALTQEFSERHSQRMSGEGNPAYTNGDSQKYVKRQLGTVKPVVCDWCGTTEKVEIHHINHDRKNNSLANLTWLCNHCNKLEAHLWHLVREGRATYEVIQHESKIELTITFARR